MKLLVSDLSYALSLKKLNHNHDVIVSVIDSNHYEYGLRIKDNCESHILECFSDTENCLDPCAPKKKQIENIINNFKSVILEKKAGNILVHCFAGVSRSTAIGVIYLHLKGYDVEDAFDEIQKSRGFGIQPNLLILRYADEILGLIGNNSLVKQVAEFSKRGNVDFVYKGF